MDRPGGEIMLFLQDLSRGVRRGIDSGSYPESYPPMVYLPGSNPRPTHPSEGSSVMLKTKDLPPPNAGGWFDKIIKTQDPPPPQGGRGLLFSQRPKTHPPAPPVPMEIQDPLPPPPPVRSGEENPKPHPPFLLQAGPFQNQLPIVVVGC